jgi:arsenite methyltransferase
VSVPTDQTELRDIVRARYAAAATATTDENASAATCCNAEGAIVTEEQRDHFGSALYDTDDREELPDAAVLASLGCGNPIAIAELHEGETVLDLGSGGGIDVLLSAHRVGPTGLAYGLELAGPTQLHLQQALSDGPGSPASAFGKGPGQLTRTRIGARNAG